MLLESRPKSLEVKKKKKSKSVKKCQVGHEFVWLPLHSPLDTYAGLVHVLRQGGRALVVLPNEQKAVAVRRLLQWAQIPFIVAPSEELSKNLQDRGINFQCDIRKHVRKGEEEDSTVLLSHDFKNLTAMEFFNVHIVIQFEVLHEGAQYAQLTSHVRSLSNLPSVNIVTLANKEVQLETVKRMGRTVRAQDEKAVFGERIVETGVLEKLREEIRAGCNFKKKTAPMNYVNTTLPQRKANSSKKDFFDDIEEDPFVTEVKKRKRKSKKKKNVNTEEDERSCDDSSDDERGGKRKKKKSKVDLLRERLDAPAPDLTQTLTDVSRMGVWNVRSQLTHLEKKEYKNKNSRK